MKQRKTVVTGATGFIGSNLLSRLESDGCADIVAIDTFGSDDKWLNVAKRHNVTFVSPDNMLDYIAQHAGEIDAVAHLGAISSTTERDADLVMATNYRLTVDLFELCRRHGIRLVYASSAATYGDGTLGFDDADDFDSLCRLRPLNVYGWSKHQTDLYIARNGGFTDGSASVAGLKFFNVYGPNEYHKGSQRSVIETFYSQALTTGTMRLFASNTPDIADGMQQRDFVAVSDVVDVIAWMLSRRDVNGIFNVGTGRPATFNTVARCVAAAMNIPCDIEYIPMPENVARQYQNYTCADISRLRQAGYTRPMTSIDDGVSDYITNYLMKPDKYN